MHMHVFKHIHVLPAVDPLPPRPPVPSAASSGALPLSRSYDTYWYSNSPITKKWIRPELRANASGFYSNLLRVKAYWDTELAAEGMMELSLPEGPATNGTWLVQQARFAFVRSMISREDTWHGRYGVMPGYGISLQDGLCVSAARPRPTRQCLRSTPQCLQETSIATAMID